MGVLQTLSNAPGSSTAALLTQPLILVKLLVLGPLVVVVLWVLADYVRVLRLRRRMPPGPFPLPVFGNYFGLPKYKPWIEYEKWAEYYGDPMITIWQGHRPTIMCNDIWSISDLLDKKANIYSSRPHMIAMGDMINATDTNQVCLVYGDRWRLHRRLMVVISSPSLIARTFRADQVSVCLAFRSRLPGGPPPTPDPSQRIQTPGQRPHGPARRL